MLTKAFVYFVLSERTLLAQRFFICYYSFIYYIILQHFVVVTQLNCCSNFISDFNHADFCRRKTEIALFVCD